MKADGMNRDADAAVEAFINYQCEWLESLLKGTTHEQRLEVFIDSVAARLRRHDAN